MNAAAKTMGRVVRKPVAVKQPHSEAAILACAHARLATLKASDMPWLSPRGRKALADAPEILGPAEFKKLR
jgi:hypothetical protein